MAQYSRPSQQNQQGSPELVQASVQSANQSLNQATLPLYPGFFGPAVADQLAALIVRHWRELIRRGEYDDTHPFDIIDLCPGSGDSGTLLCAAINRRIQGLTQIRFRYLPVIPVSNSDSDISRLVAKLPGVICKLLWDVLEPDSQPFLFGHVEPYRPGNATVLLAHDAWSQLPQELYAVHYGKLLRANLSLIKSGERKTEQQDLWTNADPANWGERLSSMLGHYLCELNSSPVVFSALAFSILSKVFELSNQHSLVISVSDGHSLEMRLRLTSFAQIIEAYRSSSKLPVNFQLLAAWVRASGGEVIDIPVSGSLNLQLKMVSPNAAQQRLQTIVRCVDSALFSSAHHLVEVCKNLNSSVSLEARLNLLQLSRHDPEVFAVLDRDIVNRLSKNIDIDQDAFRRSIERVWENHRMYPSNALLHRRIATFAMHCNHWGLARTVLKSALQETGNNSEDFANLAWCEIRTGHLDLGKSLVDQALALDPKNTLALEVERRISPRFGARDARWMVALQHPTLPLTLEPLDESHAEAYWRQYRDPQIAVMTGLPALNTLDEVRRWIQSQPDEQGRVNFAVMHADWGFVGFINLAVSAHAAFFCFWTGIDFQGAGFATAAGRLACAHAATLGVPVMLTSAYKDNHRSTRALSRIGFVPLSIRALPPDQDRIFFSLIDSSAGQVDSHRELVDYYVREKLPLQFEGYEVSGNSPQPANNTEVS
jgi:RimJ/RimL family protein N-acetyltransferase